MSADQGGQKNRNGQTIAVLFLPCFFTTVMGEVGGMWGKCMF
jgi:hypothetical protein